MNLLTLSNIVHDKASSIQFLQQRGILHDPKNCVNGHAMTLQLRDKGDRWRCHSRECRTESSVRKDTWLEGSKLAYRDIILFIYCWSKQYTKITFVHLSAFVVVTSFFGLPIHLYRKYHILF